MEPTLFPEANGTLTGGPGADYGTAAPVLDLPVHRGDGQIISCWRPSWRDRLAIIFGGRVWLRVLTTRTHAPVAVHTGTPFERIA
ncbi:MAG TPA: hypothetical protein VGP93_17260 [Polyangiaceae bacterium]|jgi:hypothetical protein|nr:hypothetical protein [Polyangiaceae bacterium]